MKKIIIPEIFILILIAGMTGCIYRSSYPAAGSTFLNSNVSIKNDLPFYDAIKKIIAPLEYSGFQDMVRPEVTLSIDFDKRLWTLHNIHEFDEQGGLLLEQGRYGLCAELSAYTYQKLKPLLKDRYDVKFGKVTESKFFSTADSNHIVVLLVDKLSQEVYFIDPSFHQYERAKNFAEYKILNFQDELSFIKEKSRDISFSVDQALPLYVKDHLLVSFSVKSIDGMLDKDNFLLVISMHDRYKVSPERILMVGKRNQQVVSYENKDLLKEVMSLDEMDMLYNKFKLWLKQMV